MTKAELIRRVKGLSQKKVAETVGVSPTVLSHIERCRREAYPKIRRALAGLYGLPEEELFDAHGQPLLVGEEDIKLSK